MEGKLDSSNSLDWATLWVSNAWAYVQVIDSVSEFEDVTKDLDVSSFPNIP